MFYKLILNAFNKARKDTNSEIVSHQSTHISEVLFEEYKFQINERTLRNYYNKVKNEEKEEDITISRHISLHLSKFLGYKDFKDFIANNSDKNFKKNNKRLKTIIISIIIISLSYLVHDIIQKDCMIWVENSHYERVRCDNKLKEGNILYNEIVFINFKRIEPDCNYQFFKSDGTENLWYLKRKNGNIEYFIYHGYHPIAKKTLRPITQYIIDKYICKKVKLSNKIL